LLTAENRGTIAFFGAATLRDCDRRHADADDRRLG
jgi:hypothetical protein